MKDLRQSENWGKYLQSLGWKYENVDGMFVYIRKLGTSAVIKIQRPEHLTTEALTKIDKIAQANKAMFVKIEVKDEKLTQSMVEAGYTKSFFPLVNPATIILNLSQDEKTLWDSLKKDAKYSVKYGEKAGLKTEFYTNPNEEIQHAFYSLHKLVGKEKKFYVQPFSELYTKTNLFKEDMVISLTYLNGKVAAGCLVPIFEGTAFYLQAAANAEGRKTLAAYYQMWQLIKYLKNKEVKQIDLEGIYDERFPGFTKDWMGFSYFKRKFGGEVVQFPYPYIKYYSKLLLKLNKFVNPLPL